MDSMFEINPEDINVSMAHLHMNFIKNIAEDAEFEDIIEENKDNKDNMPTSIHL